MSNKRKANRRKLQRVSVHAEMRQPIDWEKHAWVVLQLARIQLEAKQGQRSDVEGTER